MITINVDTAKDLVSDRIGFAVKAGWITEPQAEAYERFLHGYVEEGDFSDFDPKEFVDNMIINGYACVKDPGKEGYPEDGVVCEFGDYKIISRR